MKASSLPVLALLCVAFLGSIERSLCLSIRKRSAASPDLSPEEKQILPMVINNPVYDNNPYDNDDALAAMFYDTRPFVPAAGYGTLPEEGVFADGVLPKAAKRDSLQDLLKTLRIQHGFRFKPMRFGAGVGRK